MLFHIKTHSIILKHQNLTLGIAQDIKFRFETRKIIGGMDRIILHKDNVLQLCNSKVLSPVSQKLPFQIEIQNKRNNHISRISNIWITDLGDSYIYEDRIIISAIGPSTPNSGFGIKFEAEEFIK